MSRGRITEASIAAVREAARIDQVVAAYVTLKKAGTGSVKGLCPFHDERTPSFHVSPERGFYTCFGCGEGGDVIKFLQEVENYTFLEAIQNLADRFGVDLAYEEGTPGAPDPTATRAHRARLVAANAAAAQFYTAQLLTPEAVEARRFLSERGFDRHAAAQFDVGYAPDGWDVTFKHLASLGYTAEELSAAGLTSEGKNGPIDRFRGRLIFPIRDVSGDIVGFGARKLLPDEKDKGPKYLNTSETSIYKKSRVLYGLNMARKAISKTRRVVVVEGYTDVMACHLSGETTAVATCGTAFGEEHIRVIRRLLGDDSHGGEVIYTFDGDAAGQKAALRAFSMDDHFQTRTSVAVEPDGLDPCEVRLARGPEGIQALLADRIPLFEFAIKSTLAQYDLRTPEGRANALSATVPLLANIKHPEMRMGYEQQVGKWTGADVYTVRDLVSRAHRTTGTSAAPGTPAAAGAPATALDGATHTATGSASASLSPSTAGPGQAASGQAPTLERPDPTTARNARDALKVLVQNQRYVQLATTELRRSDFPHPTYRAVWDAVLAANDALTGPIDPTGWVHAVQSATQDPVVASVVGELAVDQYLSGGMTADTVTTTFLSLVQEACLRRIDRFERLMGDPTLAFEKILEASTEMTKAQHRHATTTERLKQHALGMAPAPADG